MSRKVAVIVGITAASLLAGTFGRHLVAAQETQGRVVTPVTRLYDRKQLLGAPVSIDVRHGRALWLQRCAYCHDGLGQPTYKTMGPWLGAETIQQRGEAMVRAVINSGTPRMPSFRYGLKPTQVDQLIAFLQTVTPDQKPTPEQLKACSSQSAVAACLAGPGGSID